MAKTTFWDIIEKTLEQVGTPLSAKEIWEKANELGTNGDFKTTGLTPWATIAANCYIDINTNGDNSKVIQISERPARFFLRKINNSNIDIDKIQLQKNNENNGVIDKIVGFLKTICSNGQNSWFLFFHFCHTYFTLYYFCLFN